MSNSKKEEVSKEPTATTSLFSRLGNSLGNILFSTYTTETHSESDYKEAQNSNDGNLFKKSSLENQHIDQEFKYFNKPIGEKDNNNDKFNFKSNEEQNLKLDNCCKKNIDCNNKLNNTENKTLNIHNTTSPNNGKIKKSSNECIATYIERKSPSIHNEISLAIDDAQENTKDSSVFFEDNNFTQETLQHTKIFRKNFTNDKNDNNTVLEKKKSYYDFDESNVNLFQTKYDIGSLELSCNEPIFHDLVLDQTIRKNTENNHKIVNKLELPVNTNVIEVKQELLLKPIEYQNIKNRKVQNPSANELKGLNKPKFEFFEANIDTNVYDNKIEESLVQKANHSFENYDDPNFNLFQNKDTVSNSPKPNCGKLSLDGSLNKITLSETRQELVNKQSLASKSKWFQEKPSVKNKHIKNKGFENVKDTNTEIMLPKSSDICKKDMFYPNCDNLKISMSNSDNEIKEVVVPKNSYNLDNFEDPNFNPFKTKNAVSNSPEHPCDEKVINTKLIIGEKHFGDPDLNQFQTKSNLFNSPKLCNKNINFDVETDTVLVNFESGIAEDNFHFCSQNVKKPIPKKADNDKLEGNVFLIKFS